MSSLLANIVGGIVSIDVDGVVLNNDSAHAGKRIDRCCLLYTSDAADE